MVWILAFGGEILKFMWRLLLWVPRRLRVVGQEKKEAERDVIVWFEKYKDTLKQQLKKETDTKKRQALEDELKQLDAGERAYYKEMLERTLERSGLPTYGELVAKIGDEPILEPENEVKLTEAITRLDRLPPPPTAEDFMASGNAKYALERYDEALADLDKALQLRPDNEMALRNRGIIYSKLQRYDEALADVNRALELSPDFPLALISRGVIYYKLEHYEEALADHNKALELRPDDPVTLNYRGVTYRHLERYQEALVDYNKALELRPDYPAALTNRGVTYNALGRFDAALADFNRSLLLSPDDPVTLNNRGVTYRHLGRYQEALTDFNKALELRPDYPEIIYNKACLFSLWLKPEEAISYLEKAIGLDEKYRQDAATDSDFDNIRDDPRFKKLIEGY